MQELHKDIKDQQRGRSRRPRGTPGAYDSVMDGLKDKVEQWYRELDGMYSEFI